MKRPCRKSTRSSFLPDSEKTESAAAPVRKTDAASRLGTEPVGRLLLRFSLPAVTGMLVNALYNVVDRIYVGQGVDLIALGGLSLVMPLMTISMSLAMLFGIGSANMISMRLGQQRHEEARNALDHCLIMLAVSGILLMAAGLIFLEPILSVLGAEADSKALDYARRYFRIILYGTPLFMVGFGLSHCTRAQGFPAITMISMILGAGINIILDPIFIFVFRLGVEGAAWATIISQAASMIWIVSFNLGSRPVVKINLKEFKFNPHICSQIMAFGSSACLLQLIMSVVQLLYNKSMGWYGASALGVENGGDIALSGMNIVGSISMLIMMPIFGINQGAQPILGYNYGAKNYRRVFRTWFLAVLASSVVCVIGFTVGELFPLVLVRAFTPNNSEALLNFAPWAMRVMFIFLPTAGFQIVSTNFFAVTGRPRVSIFLTLLRQFIVLIPCMIIFGRIWGLWGVVAAAPVADGFALLLTGTMISLEIRKLLASR